MKALTVMSSGCLIPSVRIPFGGNGNSAQDEAAGWSNGWRRSYGVSRPISVEGVGDKDADAKYNKNCCNNFKHGQP